VNVALKGYDKSQVKKIKKEKIHDYQHRDAHRYTVVFQQVVLQQNQGRVCTDQKSVLSAAGDALPADA
jgi:hypothetical protein